MKKISAKDIDPRIEKILRGKGLLSTYLYLVNKYRDPAFKHDKYSKEGELMTIHVILYMRYSMYMNFLTLSDNDLFKMTITSLRRDIPMKRIFILKGYAAYVDKDSVYVGCQTFSIKDIMYAHNHIVRWMDNPTSYLEVITSNESFELGVIKDKVYGITIRVKYDFYDASSDWFDDTKGYEEVELNIETWDEIVNNIVKYNRYWIKTLS